MGLDAPRAACLGRLRALLGFVLDAPHAACLGRLRALFWCCCRLLSGDPPGLILRFRLRGFSARSFPRLAALFVCFCLCVHLVAGLCAVLPAACFCISAALLFETVCLLSFVLSLLCCA